MTFWLHRQIETHRSSERENPGFGQRDECWSHHTHKTDLNDHLQVAKKRNFDRYRQRQPIDELSEERHLIETNIIWFFSDEKICQQLLHKTQQSRLLVYNLLIAHISREWNYLKMWNCDNVWLSPEKRRWRHSIHISETETSLVSDGYLKILVTGGKLWMVNVAAEHYTYDHRTRFHTEAMEILRSSCRRILRLQQFHLLTY